MKKYYCPDCKKKTMEKMVYTEERCLNYHCAYTNHIGHKPKEKKK